MRRLEEIALFCRDIDAAVGFYRTFLSLEPQVWAPGETATFMLGEVKLFLHRKAERQPPDWPLRDEDHLAVAVDDVDRACADLRTAGLTIEVGPREFYWGRSAYLRDLDGRLVELHQP